MRINILGSSGIIGSWLFKRFLSNSAFEVRGFFSKNCNLLSMRDVRHALSDLTGKDVLIMASAITRLKENTFNSMLKNIQMAGNVSKLIAEHPVRIVVYLSTVDVYGINIEEKVMISEKLNVSPNDFYAISKLVSEILLKKACSQHNIPLAILRLTGVYGPGDEGKSTVGNLILSALTNKTICIYGKGKEKRDFVYVDDIYRIIKRAVENNLDKVVNIATGKSYTIFQIANIIKALSKWEFNIEFKPKPDNVEKRIENIVVDCSLLRKELPGLRMTDIKEGITKYLSYISRM